jgi:LmbE family N-acetylglucosaminyl deacetylase
MAANIEEKVIEKIRALPEDRQAEVLEFVEVLECRETKADNGHAAERVAIWDKIEEIMRDVPDAVLSRIPTDGSINVDHYLYGAPKKQP